MRDIAVYRIELDDFRIYAITNNFNRLYTSSNLQNTVPMQTGLPQAARCVCCGHLLALFTDMVHPVLQQHCRNNAHNNGCDQAEGGQIGIMTPLPGQLIDPLCCDVEPINAVKGNKDTQKQLRDRISPGFFLTGVGIAGHLVDPNELIDAKSKEQQQRMGQ